VLRPEIPAYDVPVVASSVTTRTFSARYVPRFEGIAVETTRTALGG